MIPVPDSERRPRRRAVLHSRRRRATAHRRPAGAPEPAHLVPDLPPPTRPAPGHARAWQGIEGLRGLALAAVLVYHQDSSWLPGGFLSVPLFFTLSGFLITGLLLREREASHRIDVTGFWKRRVRRLLPVAMAGLLLAALVARATRPESQLGTVADDLRYAALNVANWRFIQQDTSYAALDLDPSPVTHYWSLAIEEQYYLVYPVLAALALRWRRVGLGILLLAMTLGSVAAQLLSDGGDRAYFGTDTRLAEIAIGGLFAVVWTPRVRDLLRGSLDLFAAIAAVGMGLAWWTVQQDAIGLYRGGLVAHSVLAGILVVAAADGRVTSRLTAFRPLAWFGGMSYTIYAVHFPLFVYLDADRVGIDGPGLLAVRVAASIALGTGLSHVLERPIRFGGAFPRWQAPMAAASALGIVLVIATALPHVGRTGSDDVVFGGLGESELVLGPEVEVDPSVLLPTTTTVPGATEPTGSTVAGGATSTTARGGAAAPTTTTRAPEPARALKVLMAGDSTAGVWGVGMQHWGQSSSHPMTVDLTGDTGCVLFQDGVALMRNGWTIESRETCARVVDTIIRSARTTQPDALVLMIGSIQLADWLFGSSLLPTAFGNPSFDAHYRSVFDGALRRLSGELSVPILVATIPGPRWAPINAPGMGPIKVNDDGRARRLNEINRSVVASYPRARMVPFAEAVDVAGGAVDPALHPDGLHIDPVLVPGVLDRGLEAQLREAYTSVIAAEPGLRRSGTTIWWR